MGPPIRYLTQRLLAEPAKHRLLVTLSDGRPDDFGDDYRSQYGIEDTRQALLEARQAGAVELPPPVKGLMRLAAKVMTTVAHRI